MAQAIPCDLCGKPAAEFIITLQGTGDVTGVGIECLPVFTEAVVSATDAAAAHEPADLAPGAEGWQDPPDMAVIHPTDGPDSPHSPPGASDGEWEAGYPQGPPAGRSGGGGDAPDPEREETEAAEAADVNG